MSKRLEGKTGFVTAAGQGIGRATAEAFVREGACVIATDINEALLAELATATGCETRRLDVTDANAVTAAAQAAGKVHILFNGGGSIINVASVAGSIKGAPNRFVSGATKAAVIGMTKSIAADFITRGVRCTVESPSLRERMAALAESTNQTIEQAEAWFVARQPMGRVGRTSEIAALAVYLASDESGFTTGTAQIIDGGWSN
jgi:2-keto-3-deoxy-L-fuconate dehydrogenase